MVDLATGEERSLFAPEDIHTIIVDKKLGTGAEFLLKRVAAQNGKKIGSKLEISFVGNGHSNGNGKHPERAVQTDKLKTNGNGNGYKTTMLECLRDAFDISRVPTLKELPCRIEDIRSVSLTLFIARSKIQIN